MPIAVPLHRLQLQPGSAVTVSNIGWQEFETLLQELPEHRSTRLAYFRGTLELVSPLPQHERAIVIISDVVKLLLRRAQRPWESLRSTTFKQQEIAGIEPDDCFYIANFAAVIGKERLNLMIDPPPDLAIESDLTSKTEMSAYAVLGVPELWIYASGRLTINVLQGDRYVESIHSPTFPDIAIADVVPTVIQRANEIGTSLALLEFEDWLNQQG
ncbi:MAG: Uma2 family endonuclease [Oscillatoriales cyanobacterium C42_A2020_001]|nr:Uma2 family endonuclease [Leptolyngbyaceae cyanobacterium C42_A2020_001]